MSERRARWARLVTQPRQAFGFYRGLGRLLIHGGNHFTLAATSPGFRIPRGSAVRLVDLDERAEERERLMPLNRRFTHPYRQVDIDLTAEEAKSQEQAAEGMMQDA